MKKYDYLIVGAGLFGCVFAHEMTKKGASCLVIEKRDHVGGNIYTEEIEGIRVHKYGAHIFHTSDREVWEYVNALTECNHYINSPIAIYKDELYNLPFNMNTFSKLWGIRTPQEAKDRIAAQIADLNITEPENLEEQALSLVGRDVYEKLVKGYTEKQWGRDCKELPAFIIKRLPLRFVYDNNYNVVYCSGIFNQKETKLVQDVVLGSKIVRLDNVEYNMYISTLSNTRWKVAIFTNYESISSTLSNFLIILIILTIVIIVVEGGILYFVAVGALNVGGIYFYIEPRLQHKSNLYTRKFEYKDPIFVKKGEEIGMFKMGSTVVLFASDVDILKNDCDIKFGSDLFKRKNF